MARRYVRDARGRFASKGYSGQTGGRGARLKGSGKKREGGGAVVQPKRAGEIKGTISKSSSKRRINANSRISERQIARDVAAKSTLKASSARKPKSVDALNDARKRANADLDQKRAAYFGTKYGTPQQKKARAELLAAEKRSDIATNAWRDAKAGITSKTPQGSRAGIRAEQAKGRVQQFTTAKKSVDTEIRTVRQQIKDARKNAMTFDEVAGLKLKLLNLHSKSKEYKATIERAKREI